ARRLFLLQPTRLLRQQVRESRLNSWPAFDRLGERFGTTKGRSEERGGQPCCFVHIRELHVGRALRPRVIAPLQRRVIAPLHSSRCWWSSRSSPCWRPYFCPRSTWLARPGGVPRAATTFAIWL